MSADPSIHLNPVLPSFLVAVLALGLLAVVAWGALVLRRKSVPRRPVLVLSTLRVIGVALFITALLQPVIGFTRTSAPKPELIVVIDTSRSMSLPDGDSTRIARVKAALKDGPFADHLRKNFTVRLYSADPVAAPIDEQKFAQLEATGETTRLAESLRTAAEQARAGRSNPRRILLVSDGIDHGQHDPAAAATDAGVPVDVWAVGSASTASQAPALVDVQAASRVLIGSDTRFLAVVRGEPNPGVRTLTLHLAEDGKEVQSAPLTIPAGRTEGRAEIAHRPAAAGLKRYTLRLSGAGAEPTEYPVNVRVLDRTHEVLILEDTWRWEFRYLRRTIEDDPSFRFTAVLARGPATVMQFGSPDRRASLVGIPQNADDLAPFDVFMLGDVNPSRWPRGLATEIARGVKDEGKSLVLVAGPNLGKIAEQPELHALLPVELDTKSGTPTEGDIDVRATDSTAARFFFDAADEKTALPSLERVYAPVRKRPAAHVLLETTQMSNAFGPLIVMAEHTVGRGRVLFVGTDSLYLWQTLAPPEGVTPHKAYWQRALRALAPARPIADGGLWLLPERTRLTAGQPLTVWVETRGPATGGTVAMTATTPDEKRTILATVADANKPGRWRATFTPPKPGTYQLTSVVRVDGQPAGEASTAIEVTPNSENTDTAPNPDTLTRIAQTSGGTIIDLNDPATWPTEAPVPVSRRVTMELWNDGLLLALLVVVLGLDWLLRLLRGYT